MTDLLQATNELHHAVVVLSLPYPTGPSRSLASLVHHNLRPPPPYANTQCCIIHSPNLKTFVSGLSLLYKVLPSLKITRLRPRIPQSPLSFYSTIFPFSVPYTLSPFLRRKQLGTQYQHRRHNCQRVNRIIPTPSLHQPLHHLLRSPLSSFPSFLPLLLPFTRT
ncbi:hypothetical protein K469DRAFT_149788 [Zopfia rhizophila CBS 207.26]|uniref:Uncharacterized protein n=1 Tax=Zopfia rhizophila CBS 207.26 TaxID=1314779 RepID=A0A6A6E595_9PEZI|nr:hypothetical protein K469DRAFT_149788 [Zopfia rhizophila CBS 207.26]